jgi:hypothetical protein
MAWKSSGIVPEKHFIQNPFLLFEYLTGLVGVEWSIIVNLERKWSTLAKKFF